ncbi:MAG: hypoxanthine phosphoribosyltransferase, partial [Ruminococcaceae bacterium]|nr:hypoxanthine phosphoribosyltransferase [Oscillospiraceae bacterium]
MNPQAQRRILYPEAEIQQRVREMGAEISRDYAGKELIMAAVLKGSLYFFADLTRAIDIPIQL